MGHERIGFLPRTREWNRIIEELASYNGDYKTVKIISDQTLNCIKQVYMKMPYDESVIKAIRFLVTLSISATKDDQVNYLQSKGYDINTELSTFSIVRNVNHIITTERGSLEVNKLVRDSVIQAVLQYSKSKQDNKQLSFFSDSKESIWAGIGNGSAFCELSRSFFAALTTRQLQYYIERTAASAINDYHKLNCFISNVEHHALEISDHAFETSKLVQSFSAGWYNKHANNEMPSEKDIISYLRISFGKLREEFRREAESA